MNRERAIGASQTHDLTAKRLARIATNHEIDRVRSAAIEIDPAPMVGLGVVLITSLNPLRKNPDGSITYA